MNLSDIVKKYARSEEERLLLRRILDKLEAAERKNIPAATQFLNEHEKTLARQMLGQSFPHARYVSDGGYAGAERELIVFLPDWMEEAEEGQVCAVRAAFSESEDLNHRDFLGALMGLGIKRETVGDILISPASADIILLPEILPYVLQNLTSAGRAKLSLREIGLSELSVPEPEVELRRDTVASPRLDSLVAAGFNLSRDKAAALVRSGRVNLGFMPCEKPDREVEAGEVISVRGMGRIQIESFGGTTKKGRLSVLIKKFV